MPPLVIVPIVEGHGEVAAVPILLRRWLEHRRFHKNVAVDVKGPVRASGKGALTASHSDGELGVGHYIGLALLRRPDIIVVILDADDDCPKSQGAHLLARARGAVPADFPVGVVLANRMYEAWFLAALSFKSFRDGVKSLGHTPTPSRDPTLVDVETVANPKAKIAEWLGVASYEPTVHQSALSRVLPFTTGMRRKSRSFRKLLEELESLLARARRRPPSSPRK